MPDDNAETNRLLGALGAGVEGIQRRLDSHSDKIDGLAESVTEAKIETTLGFEKVKTSIEGINRKHEAHVVFTNDQVATCRNEVDASIGALSQSINDIEDGCANGPSSAAGLSAKAKTRWVGGALTGLSAFGIWLAKRLGDG